MSESEFFKFLTDNDIIFDERIMKYVDDSPRLIFRGMKITPFGGVCFLYYNLEGNVYNEMTAEVDVIKTLWNVEAEKQIKRLDNIKKLTDKL